MGVSTGVIAVAVQDGDARDVRGDGQRGVAAELRVSAGDDLGLKVDGQKVTNLRARAKVRLIDMFSAPRSPSSWISCQKGQIWPMI